MSPVVKSIQSRLASAARAQRQRVYNTNAWRQCRAAVLARDPVCTICHHQPSTIADHYPLPLADLLRLRLDPFDTTACRGVCRLFLEKTPPINGGKHDDLLHL